MASVQLVVNCKSNNLKPSINYESTEMAGNDLFRDRPGTGAAWISIGDISPSPAAG